MRFTEMNLSCYQREFTDIIYLGDLGVSRQVSEDTVMLKTFYGTPLYLSPELIENRPYNEKTDLWSMGIILYELASLRLPFRGDVIFVFVVKLLISSLGSIFLS